MNHTLVLFITNFYSWPNSWLSLFLRSAIILGGYLEDNIPKIICCHLSSLVLVIGKVLEEWNGMFGKESTFKYIEVASEILQW